MPRPSFALTEAIGLTRWGRAEAAADVERFRQFRRFTSAIAAVLVDRDEDNGDQTGAYLGRDFLIDADAVDDAADDAAKREWIGRLRAAFPVLHRRLREQGDIEFVFLTLGSLLLAHWDGDIAACKRLAKHLLDEEAGVRRSMRHGFDVIDSRFVYGLTDGELVYQDWWSLAASLTNPGDDPELATVIGRLAESSVTRDAWERRQAP